MRFEIGCRWLTVMLAAVLGSCGGGGDSPGTAAPPPALTSGPPAATSVAAASATAQSNALCTAIQPFYWEIGDASAALASGSSTTAGGTAVTAATNALIASASKWIYGMYVVQKRGGAANLTAADIKFLTFSSGYTYMGSDTQSATCTPPGAGVADSINACLTPVSYTHLTLP